MQDDGVSAQPNLQAGLHVHNEDDGFFSHPELGSGCITQASKCRLSIQADYNTQLLQGRTGASAVRFQQQAVWPAVRLGANQQTYTILPTYSEVTSTMSCALANTYASDFSTVSYPVTVCLLTPKTTGTQMRLYQIRWHPLQRQQPCRDMQGSSKGTPLKRFLHG